MFKNLGGKEMALEEMRQNWEQPYMKFWHKYYPEMTLEEEQNEYRRVILSKECPKAHVYPGIVGLIKKLKEKGISMAVLSSDLSDTIFPEIRNFGLENIFCDVSVDVHDKTGEICNLLKRNNFDTDETVFVGDTNLEIEAGKYAGIKTIAVTWGFYSEHRLKTLNPDFIVHNIKELEEVLLK